MLLWLTALTRRKMLGLAEAYIPAVYAEGGKGHECWLCYQPGSGRIQEHEVRILEK